MLKEAKHSLQKDSHAAMQQFHASEDRCRQVEDELSRASEEAYLEPPDMGETATVVAGKDYYY